MCTFQLVQESARERSRNQAKTSKESSKPNQKMVRNTNKPSKKSREARARDARHTDEGEPRTKVRRSGQVDTRDTANGQTQRKARTQEANNQASWIYRCRNQQLPATPQPGAPEGHKELPRRTLTATQTHMGGLEGTGAVEGRRVGRGGRWLAACTKGRGDKGPPEVGTTAEQPP